jgi:hypothetical protein
LAEPMLKDRLDIHPFCQSFSAGHAVRHEDYAKCSPLQLRASPRPSSSHAFEAACILGFPATDQSSKGAILAKTIPRPIH